MEQLTKTQLVLLVLLVSFMTSLVTGIVTVTLVNQAPPAITQTIFKVMERAAIIKDDGDEEIIEEVILITQEDLIIKLARESQEAVVSIIASKNLPIYEQYFINPFQNDDFFGQIIPFEFFPNLLTSQYRENGIEKNQISRGTGFFVSSDGLLITNNRVVLDTDTEYSVIMNDGSQLLVEVVVRDPIQDIAILKVEGSGYSYFPLGNSDNLSTGQTVVAIGNTLGEVQNTVSTGVISSLSSVVIADGVGAGSKVLQKIIQTDASINLGNSGGPLLDLAGRVVGINTVMVIGVDNVGFALPINIVKKNIADVNEFSKIQYAYLGVGYIIINNNIQAEKELSVNYGALLTQGPTGESAIIPESPAALAGIKVGDIILEFNDKKITKNNTLANMISQSQVGELINLKILRGEEEIVIDVELVERAVR